MDCVLAALDVIRSFPQAARHLEDVVGYDHGERRTLLGVSPPYAFTADFERGVENMDDQLKAFALYLAAEFEPLLPLNQAELEYDVVTGCQDIPTVTPD
jgi:hypothetical protein